ncbi:MAG: Nicotinate-nucleotide adenylyltransferase, partial [uncultured Microvirga sp.]
GPPPAASAGSPGRPVWRLVQPGPCRAPPCHSFGHAAASARPGVVDRDARQSPEGAWRVGPDRRARHRRRGARAASADRGHGVRGGARRPLYGGHARLPGSALPRGALRMDHGGRQPGRVPPLARLAAHRRDRPGLRRRPPGLDASGRILPSRNGARAFSTRRERRRPAAAFGAAGLDLPPRPALVPVLDGAANEKATIRPGAAL